uniref:Uncharacterized protein n=1 Tax=uncultured marine virus TaxID=186617 RepID=A0A0F7L8N8_9VIRU|nr:hypothetical protein [uncultured marine virus]
MNNNPSLIDLYLFGFCFFSGFENFLFGHIIWLCHKYSFLFRRDKFFFMFSIS